MRPRYGYTWAKGVAAERSGPIMDCYFEQHKPERTDGQWLGSRSVDDVATAGYREYWYEGYRLGCIHPEGEGWRWVSLCGLIADGFTPTKTKARAKVQERADLSMMMRHGGLTSPMEAELEDIPTKFG